MPRTRNRKRQLPHCISSPYRFGNKVVVVFKYITLVSRLSNNCYIVPFAFLITRTKEQRRLYSAYLLSKKNKITSFNRFASDSLAVVYNDYYSDCKIKNKSGLKWILRRVICVATFSLDCLSHEVVIHESVHVAFRIKDHLKRIKSDHKWPDEETHPEEGITYPSAMVARSIMEYLYDSNIDIPFTLPKEEERKRITLKGFV